MIGGVGWWVWWLVFGGVHPHPNPPPKGEGIFWFFKGEGGLVS